VLRFLAHFLFLLAAWTVVIKYLFPIWFAVTHEMPAATYIYPDLWPVVHVWLGWSLLHWRRYTLALALTMSVAEIAIVAIKLAAFLAEPEWTIWRTNWFINKLFVLACFVMLLGYLLVNLRRVRGFAVVTASMVDPGEKN
jgi:hypothetical protein